MRNYLIDYQLSKIVHASYIYLFYYRCIYRCALKVKGSCATLHFSSPKLKILGLSNASLYKKRGNNENAYQKICIFVFQKRNVCILPCK